MIQVEHHEGKSTIHLNFKPLNLLTYERIQDIIKAHQVADASDKGRVIVMRSLIPGIFSHGFDPKYLLDKNESERTQIFHGISELIYSLLGLKKPLIAIIDGDAYAGGAVLASLADFRIFHTTKGKLSFSESKVGLALPSALIEVLRNFVRPGDLRELIMLGKNVDSRTAQEIGLSNWQADDNNLEEVLNDKVAKLSRISSLVHQINKEKLNKRARNRARKLMRTDKDYRIFMGQNQIGEGLSALIEKRPAKFI